MKTSYTYIISNLNRTVLYTGVTSDLERRILEHKAKAGSKFAAKYNCTYLLYYEEFYNIIDAIEREKAIKNRSSKWKWNLIKEDNPEFIDLASDWFKPGDIQSIIDELNLYKR
jgi:putative endonuclease